MAQRRLQEEKPFPRDPGTQIIRGAEGFDFGQGDHAVLFLHGWTSTPRELRFLAEKTAAAGFRCQGLLLKGHGTTIRALHGVNFSDHLAESEEAFGKLALAHERVSICGLSLGGLLALNIAARRRVANLILIAPFLKPAGTTFGLPNRWLVGRVPLSGYVGKNVAGPINDPAGLEGHIAYHAMPAQEMVSIVQATRDFQGMEGSISCPTLVLHSVNDTTSDFSGSLALMQNLGSDDKTLIAFNRGNHVITLDYDRESLEAKTVEWLQRHQLNPG